MEALFVKSRTEVCFASSRSYQILSGEIEEEDREYVDQHDGIGGAQEGVGSRRRNVGERAQPDPWTEEEDAELKERMSLYVFFIRLQGDGLL